MNAWLSRLTTIGVVGGLVYGLGFWGGPQGSSASPAVASRGSNAPLDQPAGTRFAVVGDFGSNNSEPAISVANLIRSWNVDYVVTVGDNNYCTGNTDGFEEFDLCVGRYYYDFMSPYLGAYGTGASSNKFWPALGNHDWDAGISGWNAFFTLPNNERYYEFVRGSVHFFVIDSDPREPDGTSATSTQGQWLQTRMAASTAPWKIVVFHHPAFSSAQHGSSSWMQWPFQQWGATAVLSGHDHSYERIDKNGLPYIVNGLGGRSPYGFGTPIAGSIVRYNSDYGAMLVNADACGMTFQFWNRQGVMIDTLTQSQPCDTPTPTATATASATSTSTPPPSATASPTTTLSPTAGATASLTSTATYTVTTQPTATSAPTIGSVHVADLDAASATYRRNQWRVTVSVLAHEANHNPRRSATVTGNWSGGASGIASCRTGSNGRCTVTSAGIQNSRTSTTFAVTDIRYNSYPYASVENHDLDGDSNGTSVTVTRP
ncbi:MAG: hypothetical protein HW416_3080 [Chloroflexi bacterium]|nr:hypothetical protein [Chloroflexota bacterium]